MINYGNYRYISQCEWLISDKTVHLGILFSQGSSMHYHCNQEQLLQKFNISIANFGQLYFFLKMRLLNQLCCSFY